MTATFLSLVSNDFLLPYSFPPERPPIPRPIPPLGDIKRTDPTKIIPATIINTIRTIRMCTKKKDKQCVSQRYRFAKKMQTEKMDRNRFVGCWYIGVLEICLFGIRRKIIPVRFCSTLFHFGQFLTILQPNI